MILAGKCWWYGLPSPLHCPGKCWSPGCSTPPRFVSLFAARISARPNPRPSLSSSADPTMCVCVENFLRPSRLRRQARRLGRDYCAVRPADCLARDSMAGSTTATLRSEPAGWAKARMAWSFLSQVDVMSTTKLGTPSIVSPVAIA